MPDFLESLNLSQRIELALRDPAIFTTRRMIDFRFASGQPTPPIPGWMAHELEPEWAQQARAVFYALSAGTDPDTSPFVTEGEASSFLVLCEELNPEALRHAALMLLSMARTKELQEKGEL